MKTITVAPQVYGDNKVRKVRALLAEKNMVLYRAQQLHLNVSADARLHSVYEECFAAEC